MKASHIFTGWNASIDFIKNVHFRKPKLNMFWQRKHFFAHLDIQCWMPPFAPTETGNILIPTSHRGPGSNPSPQTSGQLTSTSQPSWCFPPMHCSFCLASHWGWTSWLAIQGEQEKTQNVIEHVSLSWLWLTTFTLAPWAHTPGSVVEWLWGTQPFSAVLCGWLKGMANKRNLSEGSFSPEFTMSYLNLAGEMTYKQTADVVPDGGKILWHIERLLLPEIHSLLSRIQPFHQFLWVSVVATGETKQKHISSWGWDNISHPPCCLPCEKVRAILAPLLLHNPAEAWLQLSSIKKKITN